MTTGIFKFQIVQEHNQPLLFSGLGHTQQVKIQQRDQIIMIDEKKIDELIETLKACKRWLNSP